VQHRLQGLEEQHRFAAQAQEQQLVSEQQPVPA
jgi:hypothetical protein